MPQHDPSDLIAERLYVMTLALEAALRDNEFADAQSLFDARSDLLDQIEANPPASSATLARVSRVNQRIELDMMTRSRALASEIEKGIRGLNAHKAYRSSHGHSPGSSTNA